MPVTVVVGGQYGSEGKGKVAKYLAENMGASAVIRCGGTNSGHTAISNEGFPLVFRQLPTAALLPDVKLVLTASTYIDLDILRSEIAKMSIGKERLYIDPNAVILTEELKVQERSGSLVAAIGSTGSGTGAGVLQRIGRSENILFARDVEELKPYIRNTNQLIREILNAEGRVVLEGTQGFGLSLYHSQEYPYVTSRDTTATGFLSEAGLSPFDVDDIVLVIRTYPIRVGGQSGPLKEETSWSAISKNIGKNICERTSVTNNVRRVAEFDPVLVKKAISYNLPTRIVLNHLDYLFPANVSNSERNKIALEFIARIEQQIGQRIDLVGAEARSLVRMENFFSNKVQFITHNS